ncbi:hypothetical protein [Streptomyces sp. V1I6]|uniref:hypothetical protein n=1 Tax=Streptomyces sp. V1I6 TaxID=3042273 RepID=UPI0027852C90|nr:hypothetical protein [Streptomyces sp. V1I6]MDQ0848004.1 hypothetical protein [Streptomyces sp. V1I6]
MNRWKALACAAAATLGISMLAQSPASAATGFTFERPGARVVGKVSVSGNTVYLSGTVKDTPPGDGYCAWVRVTFHYTDSPFNRVESRKACGAGNPAASWAWNSPSTTVSSVDVFACSGSSSAYYSFTCDDGDQVFFRWN